MSAALDDTLENLEELLDTSSDEEIIIIEEYGDQHQCPVCFGEMDGGGHCYLHPCHHKMHTVCANQWSESHGKKTCPVCRGEVVKKL